MTELKNYHHGDLKTALLEAAERILSEEGAGALTLRACARAAGVSHAAPAHHFGNLSGLLTSLAVTAFERLAICQRDELARAGVETAAQKRAVGLGYVRFALENPALFDLIFKDPRIDKLAPEYMEAVRIAGEPLRRILETRDSLTPNEARLQRIRSWSLVHGFATLATSGAFNFPGAAKLEKEELLQLAAKIMGG